MMTVNTFKFEDDIAGVLDVRVSSDLAKYRCEYRGYLESRCNQHWQFVVFLDDEGNRHADLRFSEIGEDSNLVLYRLRVCDIVATVNKLLKMTGPPDPESLSLIKQPTWGLGAMECLQYAGISGEMVAIMNRSELAKYEYVYYCLEAFEDNSLDSEPGCVLMDDDEEEWLVLMHKLAELPVPELPEEYRCAVISDHIWQIRDAMQP